METNDVEIYYCGQRGHVQGHYYYAPRGEPFSGCDKWVGEHRPPWGPNSEYVDKLQPIVDGKRAEGAAALHFQTALDGAKWTALAFWDQSGDHQLGSNSNFLARSPSDGNCEFFTFDQMIELALEHFPDVMERIKNSGMSICMIELAWETRGIASGRNVLSDDDGDED